MTIEQFAEEYPGYFPHSVYVALGKYPYDPGGKNRLGALPCLLRLPRVPGRKMRHNRLLFWPPAIFAMRFPDKSIEEGTAIMLQECEGVVVLEIGEPVAPTLRAPEPDVPGTVGYIELGRWSLDAQPAPDRLPALRYLDEALAAGRAEYGKAAIKRFWVRSENGDGIGGYYACRPGYGLFTTAHVDCWLQGDGNWREDYRRVQFGQKVEDQDGE